MGFLDSLKNVKNFVTGGSAEVSLEAADPRVSQPFRVTVRAAVGDGEVKISRVYLRVRAVEEVRVKDVPVPLEETVNGQRQVVGMQNGDLERQETLFNQEFVIGGPQTLERHSQNEWSTEVTLPAQAQPTYLGVNARLLWSLYAGLDTFGNDPDSGWVTVDVQP